MKIKPILFSTEMVQAILNGTKKQTRRIIKPQPIFKENVGKWFKNEKINEVGSQDFVIDFIIKNATYQVGDILWIRETFIEWSGKFQYKPLPYGEELGKWKPSIHMPKEAARIFLKVTNVRCERLHDISEDDAIAEGCSLYGPFGEYKGSIHPNGGGMRYRGYSTAKRAFQCIWETINCKESWKQNPFVWVYEFEVTEKPENFI